jgi:hypothetical protein
MVGWHKGGRWVGGMVESLHLHIFFFMPKRISRHVGWSCPDTACHVVWHGPDDIIWQHVRPMFPTFSRHVCMSADDMSCGGVSN